jgi:F-type H+-transporting ATPase subunit b
MSELIRHFGIDVKLLFAQAVNFLVLLFILRVFMYRPVLELLKARKKKIESGLQMAKEAEERLRGAQEEKREVLRQAVEEAMKIGKTAEEAGKRRKEDMIREAGVKAEGIFANARRLMREERAKLDEEAERRTKDLVRLGLEKLISRLPSAERDEKMIEEALTEAKELKKKAAW